MKPFIGVVLRPEKTRGHNDVMVLYDAVRCAIVKYGGIPLCIIPPTMISYVDQTRKEVRRLTEEEEKDINCLLCLCKGVILPGGDEIMDYDLYILEYCYQKKIPTLGICMGMQAMGLKFGGNVEPFSTNINHKIKKSMYAHLIKIDYSSKLLKILKKSVILVNSFHKCSVKHTTLDVVAKSEDGIIEAIEDKNHPFFIGVQWHPETMISYDIMSQRLFESFFQAVEKR